MNLTIKTIDDKHIWESFIQIRSPYALFQSWLWGELQKALGRNVNRYGFFNDTSLVGIAQTIQVEARRGTFLHIRHGPIVHSDDKTTWQEIIHFLKIKAKERGAWFVRMSPLLGDTPQNKTMFETLGCRSAPIGAMDGELCWVLDITRAEAELLMNMRKTTRYEIRQAQKLGVVIQSSTDTKDIGDFFVLYDATAKRHGFVKHTGISQEFEFYAKNNQAVLYKAYYEKKLIAAAIILYYNRQAIYHHSASLPTKIPAMSLLLWKAMCDAKKQGCSRFNFWGVASADKPHHPWRGITLFKKGFGGEEVRSLHAWDLPVSPFYILPYAVESLRRLRKGY